MKKIVFVSTIMAFIVASLSAFSAFAAPATANAPKRSEQIFGNQFRELTADRAWFNSFRTNHSNFVNVSEPLRIQQYLNRYAVALAKAEAIVKSRGTVVVTSKSTNAQVSSITHIDQADTANLAVLLHEMRALQVRLNRIG